jgi:hypothetical protein
MSRSGAFTLLSCIQLVACGDGSSTPMEPEVEMPTEVSVWGYVTSLADGSPIEAATVSATQRQSYACDLDFCRYRTVGVGSATSDSNGLYRLSLNPGCADLAVYKPGYVHSDDNPQSFCVAGAASDSAYEGLRIDLKLDHMEPTIVIRGRVTSSVDADGIHGVRVSVYSQSDITDRLTSTTSTYGGGYIVSLRCEEQLYVRAECLESPFPSENCSGWEDSAPIRVQTECPLPGSPAVEKQLNFVLSPAR